VAAGAVATAAVKAGVPTSLQVDPMLRVDLPADAVDADTTLYVRQATPPAVPAGLHAAALWDVALDGARLTAPATLTWTAPRAADGVPPGLLPVFYDEQAERWTPADARTDPATGAVVVTTTHFSRWGLFTWDPGALTRTLTDTLTGFVAPPPVNPPACPGEQDARTAGVQVRSSDGDLVRWCVGRQNDVTVLQVTNNRGYALSLVHPADWRMTDLGPQQPLLDAVATTVGRLATSTPRGYSLVMLGPGQTLSLQVRGTRTDVQVEPSPPAFLGSALVYGLETLSMTFGAVPGGPDVSNGKLVELARGVLKNAECVSSFRKLAGQDVTTPDALFEVWKNAVGLSFGCLEKQWKTTYGDEGVLATFWLGAVTWLADGVGLVVQGVTAMKDTIQNVGGYVIRVTLPVDAARTEVVRVRPVTGAGQPAPGWSVSREDTVVECGYASPAAVSGDVQYCSPAAASADVCWSRPGGASVLCLWDPWERTVHEYAATGVAPHVDPVADVEPLGLELADGTRCRLRNGGSWDARTDDDTLAGFYSCGDAGAVWAKQNGSAFDRTTSAWTVRVGTSTGPLTVQHVVKAYVAATA